MAEDSVIKEYEGKWWFWDETWADRYGPYLTQTEAKAALLVYCREVLENKSTPKPNWAGSDA